VSLGEDDVLLREGIARILADAGLDVVVQSGDAEDLLRRTLAYRPDVVSSTCGYRRGTASWASRR
jgi:DNA-binding NarL/FixJ family response regulator